jgi:hypothetical protein
MLSGMDAISREITTEGKLDIFCNVGTRPSVRKEHAHIIIIPIHIYDEIVTASWHDAAVALVVGRRARASEVRTEIYCLALMMLMNSGFSEAPPTRNPSTSGWWPSSLQFSAVTEPPYKIRTDRATSAFTFCSSQ